MAEHTVTLTGDVSQIGRCMSVFSTPFERLVQISNPNVNMVGLYEVFRGTGYFLKRATHNEDVTITECDCSDLEEPEKFYREHYNHTSECPVSRIYNLASEFSSNETPLTVHFDKQSDSLVVKFEDTYRDLDESRTLYEEQSDVNDIVTDEVSRALRALGKHFPTQSGVKYDWLWSGGDVSISLDPNIRYQNESHKNRIHISISGAVPQKPIRTKINHMLSVTTTPRPFTFDLREFTLGSFDRYTPEAMRKCGYESEIPN